MAGFRRRLLWGAGLGVLVLIGLAAYAYFVGTRTLLEHAESFAFRRMTVSGLEEPGIFRFFYVTNRRPDIVDGAIDERFSCEREESLKFGAFDTKIEPTLGLGMVINPSDWFINEEIPMKSVDSLEQAAFVAQLRE